VRLSHEIRDACEAQKTFLNRLSLRQPDMPILDNTVDLVDSSHANLLIAIDPSEGPVEVHEVSCRLQRRSGTIQNSMELLSAQSTHPISMLPELIGKGSSAGTNVLLVPSADARCGDVLAVIRVLKANRKWNSMELALSIPVAMKPAKAHAGGF